MFRIVSKKYLDKLRTEIENLKTELIAVYGDNGFNKAKPCQLCMKRRGLTEHHLIPRKKRYEAAQRLASEANISIDKALINIRLRKVKICRHCHNLIHKNYNAHQLMESGSTFDDLVSLYRAI